MKQDKKPHSSSNVLLPDRDPEELVLTYAGNIIKHLGVQMYAGRPVPAIAELISNAWDADARKVDVHLPLDEPWDSDNPDQYIEVSDNGNGMNWEMVRDAYLDVGRDRRIAEDTDKSPGGRPLQGRKGVGKLAGFGIADILEVQTVYLKNDPSIHEKALIWIRLDLQNLREIEAGSAQAEVIFAGPISKAPKDARRKQGTTVILRHLNAKKAQNSTRFHHSMAQRFLLIGPKFRVKINGKALRKEDIDLQWRWPESGWLKAKLEGFGDVLYWIGFTERPRKQNEGELSGILIYTRGKISQEATFFEISGGVTGQHGLRYMVGMMKAEWLDEGRHSPDLIATHRGSIAWESPQGAAFQSWGQGLLKKYLAEWAKRRAKLREKQIRDVSPTLRKRIDNLAPSYRDAAVQFIDKFKSVEMEPEEFEQILSWFIDALENATLRSILEKLRETSIDDLEKLDELFSKMEIRTAVTLLQIIESNLVAIESLERMHRDNAKERGVLSKHLEKNPWLIDPTWMLSKAEVRVSTWIKEEFDLEDDGSTGGKNRADFFCVAVGGTLHIVEIKRGAYMADEKDILQADKYRKYVDKRFQQLTDQNAIKYGNIQSHLVSAKLNDTAESIKQAYADKGWVYFTTWDDLIERAKYSHTQFRDALKKQAESEEINDQIDDGEPAKKIYKASAKKKPQKKKSTGKKVPRKKILKKKTTKRRYKS